MPSVVQQEPLALRGSDIGRWFTEGFINRGIKQGGDSVALALLRVLGTWPSGERRENGIQRGTDGLDGLEIVQQEKGQLRRQDPIALYLSCLCFGTSGLVLSL